MQLNETTPESFRRSADVVDPALGQDMRAAITVQPDPAALARLSNSPRYNAQWRTTCATTMLSVGHASNALPQTARATVNCRILPGPASRSSRP